MMWRIFKLCERDFKTRGGGTKIKNQIIIIKTKPKTCTDFDEVFCMEFYVPILTKFFVWNFMERYL